MRVVVTGAEGFLGWHLRALLLTVPDCEVVPVGRSRWTRDALTAAVSGADVVFHLAGINRAGAHDVEHGNIALAEQLVQALNTAGAGGPGGKGGAAASPPVVVSSGSTQARLDVPYGRGKRIAAERLAQWAGRVGAAAVDVRFPGLFGEHGRPAYNSFVATFADRIAGGGLPEIENDRELPLLHVHEAARILVDVSRERHTRIVEPDAHPVRISHVARLLERYHAAYGGSDGSTSVGGGGPVTPDPGTRDPGCGDIPELGSPFEVALFNTYRAALWSRRPVIPRTPRSDRRGTLVESVRMHGGQGQTFVSTTHPGFVRGEHFHFRKIERFQVVHGTALIRLRKLFEPVSAVQTYEVSGARPCAIDMPTLWTHSIENIGTCDLTTLFWTSELFDPADPDTYPHPVLQET